LLDLGFSKDLDYLEKRKNRGPPFGATFREGPGLKSHKTLC
jgi:hypothetical protein